MQWSGFHRLPLQDRIDQVAEYAGLDAAERRSLDAGLAVLDAEPLIENVIGRFTMPLGVAVGFVVDGEDVVVPMAVEESSVVAAASHGAKLAAKGSGFETIVDEPVMIGQIELRDVANPTTAKVVIETQKAEWVAALNARIPSMVARGGGVRDIEARSVQRRVVLHVLVDCRDAMGANLVNDLCEHLAPMAADATGGTVGLRILSNLATHRMAEARCRIPVEVLGGMEVARAIVAANDFAIADPYRAATHNKGIMNGVDPVVMATGNDWRAVEAGAHAYAARDGYKALTTYAIEGEALVATLRMPMALGTVGGVTALHPTAKTCLKILGTPDARRLAAIAVSVGLAQNLSALKALATEGIQKGHMALHAKNIALQAGLTGDVAAQVAARMAEEGHVSVSRAKALAGQGP